MCRRLPCARRGLEVLCFLLFGFIREGYCLPDSFSASDVAGKSRWPSDPAGPGREGFC